MYIVNLINDGVATEIHGCKDKLISGNIIKGINTIDSFTFAMLMSNKGFYKIHELKTLVTVFNTNKKRYEFHGRVLKPMDNMSESGLITREVVCESFLGFLCDSKQSYVEEKNWTVRGLLEHIINKHNSQVEEYKRFAIGAITVTDVNDNIYVGIQRENTWKTIEDKLIGKLGGEIRFRVEGDVTYIDYLKEIGNTSITKIALSKNMKAITKEKDPTEFITRLIPLGCKLTVEAENGTTTESEERLDITSVNDGCEYIDDEEAIAEYGVIVDYVYFDDVTDASNLLRKGKEYLKENNRVKIKYSISALDLSLIGLDIDDYEVCNYHPIENALLGIDDTARIVKKNVNVCEENASTIEVGDNFKTLSEIQYEQAKALKNMTSNFATSSQVSNAQKNAVANATALITSAMGGYVVKTNDELLIMDTDNIETAKKVWRWNINGLAYSSTGYNGEYALAMTMDGGIVADFITSGKLSADRIYGGTLSLGGENNGYGAAMIYNSNGDIVGWLNESGVVVRSDDAQQIAWMKEGYTWFYIDEQLCGSVGGCRLTDGDQTLYGLMLKTHKDIISFVNSKGNSFCVINPNGVYLEHIDSSDIYNFNGNARFYDNVYCNKNVEVAGQMKAEIVKCNRMSVQGGADQEVEWVWDSTLQRYCLCTIT